MLSRHVLPLTLLLCISSIQATQEVVLKATDTSQILFAPPGTAGWEYSGPSSATDCGGDYSFSASDNSTLTVTFTGVAFTLNLIRFSTGARAAIELDGVPQTVVDTFASTTDCTTATFSKTGLTYTQHKLTVADATHTTATRWLRFRSLTYTDFSPAERGAVTSSMSIASVSTASIASVSSVSVSSARAAASAASERRDRKGRNGAIGGGIAGAIGFLLIVGIIVLLFRKRKTAQASTPVGVQPVMQYQQPAQGEWKDQSSTYPSPLPYSTPGNPPYPPAMMTQSTGQTATVNGSTTNFAAYPGYPAPYQQPQMPNMAPPQGYGSPMPQYPQPMYGDIPASTGQPQVYGQPHAPQPMYGDRPMSQYAMPADSSATMYMNGAMSPNQPGGPPQGVVAEPMEVYSSARQVSGMPPGYNPHQASHLPGSPNQGGLGLHTPNLPQPM